jgi:hypothetical protein
MVEGLLCKCRAYQKQTTHKTILPDPSLNFCFEVHEEMAELTDNQGSPVTLVSRKVFVYLHLFCDQQIDPLFLSPKSLLFKPLS